MATHPEQHKAPEHKADPHKGETAAADAPPPPQQMEVGGTGTAKVSFTDVNGADVPLASVTWTATGSATVTADDKDPTSANVVATAPGRAHVKAAVVSQSGAPAEAAVEIRVIETGTPSEGKIELSIQPAKKAK